LRIKQLFFYTISKHKFNNHCNSFNMSNIIRLDRLSALLRAFAPRVFVAGSSATPHANLEQTLCVYLVLHQSAVLLRLGQPPKAIAAGSVVIARADIHPAVNPAIALYVQLEGPAATLLMGEFAQPMVLSLDGADTALALSVELLCSELAAPRCGQPAMLSSAGDILFIGLLRQLVARPQTSSGLFASLADSRIAATLVAMHGRPQDPWDLEALAALAGMSRTAFATRFKEAMSISPGKYLASLRLLVAQAAVDCGKGLKGAARESGYRDVSALSRALGRARLAGACRDYSASSSAQPDSP
jgi:AraC-like DNA-binding protein